MKDIDISLKSLRDREFLQIEPLKLAIQVTDAPKELALQEDMVTYDFDGRRYNVGDKPGFLEVRVEIALRRDDLRAEFLAYLEKNNGKRNT